MSVGRNDPALQPVELGPEQASNAPHLPLLGYYDGPQLRANYVRDLFNRTAGVYDGINTAFALGSGGWYRRRALQRAGLRPGMRMLDVAVGTGLLAREATGILGGPQHVTGLDPSEGMLAQARRTLEITLAQGRGESLPFADSSFDMLGMGYALRHMADLAQVFSEFRRVLRPDGRVVILEITRPESRLGLALLRAYLGTVVPAASRLAGADAATLMKYYWDAIEACVPPARILQHLRQAGFRDVGCDTDLGVMRAYRAVA